MKKYVIFALVAVTLICSCQEPKSNVDNTPVITQADLKASFDKAMRVHLDAVEQKDIATMQKTMAPNDELFFLQPGRELSKTSTSFMDFHKGWFEGTMAPWSISFKIIETRVGSTMGVAVVECLYEEPDRDGKPYFNRLHVSYAQQLIDGQWYVTLDQATSIEKSTD